MYEKVHPSAVERMTGFGASPNSKSPQRMGAQSDQSEIHYSKDFVSLIAVKSCRKINKSVLPLVEIK